MSFDRDRVAPTSRRSQKRLFASRHRQAKKQRRGERRRRKFYTIILPLIAVGLVAASGMAFWDIYLANQEAEDKMTLDREAEDHKRQEEIQATRGLTADEVKNARDRFLLRDSSPPGAPREARKK